MIYSHLFGVFALVAQFITFLIYLYYIEKHLRTKFLITISIGGAILTLTYLPVFNYLFNNKDRQETWILPPTESFLYTTIQDFLGHNEFVIILCLVLILSFCVYVFNSKEKEQFGLKNSLQHSNFPSIFILLFLWITVTYFIPYIISFVQIPILYNRYLIHTLPAILLLMALGVFTIKNNLIQNITITFIVFLSLFNLAFVDKYYNSVHKSQFREIVTFIKENDFNEKQDFVSTLGMYYDAFLENEINKKFISSDINTYIKNVMDKNSPKAFWYTGGHNDEYTADPHTSNYLDTHYIIDFEVNLFGSWAKHFVPINQYSTPTLEIHKMNAKTPIKAWIESYEIIEGKIVVSGWGFLENENAEHSKINVIIFNDSQAYLLPVEIARREDIVKAHQDEKVLLSGFKVNFPSQKINNGTYKMGVLIKNQNKTGLYKSDFEIEINNITVTE